jgi:hypothetical protein
LRLTIQNRHEFTNLSELTLSYELEGSKGEIHPSIAPGQTREIEIPFTSTVEPGSQLFVRFLNPAGEVVDEERIPVGEKTGSQLVRPDCARLEVKKIRLLEVWDDTLISVLGTNFEVGFSERAGTIRRLVARGYGLLHETPHFHYLPIDPGFPTAPPLWTWKLASPFLLAQDGENVVVTAGGTYGDVSGNLTYRITPWGELDIRYECTYLGPEVAVREVGLRFAVPLWMDTLTWNRHADWSIYPEDHIGRVQGRVRPHSQTPRVVPPSNPCSQDDSPMGCDDFRSTKRNIEYASITDLSGSGLFISSNGNQHLRACVETDRIAIHVNDWFGGSAAAADEEWSPYGKGRVLKPHEHLQGALLLQLVRKESDL